MRRHASERAQFPVYEALEERLLLTGVPIEGLPALCGTPDSGPLQSVPCQLTCEMSSTASPTDEGANAPATAGPALPCSGVDVQFVASVDKPALAVAKMLIQSVKDASPDLADLEQVWLQSGKPHLGLETDSPAEYVDRLVKLYGVPVYWQDDLSGDAIWTGIQASMQNGLALVLITDPRQVVVVADAWLDGSARRLRIADPRDSDFREITLVGQMLVGLAGGDQAVESMLCIRPTVKISTLDYGTVTYTAATHSLSGAGVPSDPGIVAGLKGVAPYMQDGQQAAVLDQVSDGPARRYLVALTEAGRTESAIRELLADRYDNISDRDPYEFPVSVANTDGQNQIFQLVERIDEFSLAFRPEFGVAQSPGWINPEEAAKADAAHNWFWIYHPIEDRQLAFTDALRKIVSHSGSERTPTVAEEAFEEVTILALGEVLGRAINAVTGEFLAGKAQEILDRAVAIAKANGLDDVSASVAGFKSQEFYAKLRDFQKRYDPAKSAFAVAYAAGTEILNRAIAASIPVRYLDGVGQELQAILDSGLLAYSGDDLLLRNAIQTVVSEITGQVSTFWSQFSQSVGSIEFAAELSKPVLEFALKYVGVKAGLWGIPVVGEVALAIEIGFILGDLLTNNSQVAEAFATAKYSKDIESILHRIAYAQPDGLHHQVAQAVAGGTVSTSLLQQYKAAVHLTELAEATYYRKVGEGLNAQPWLVTALQEILLGRDPHTVAALYLQDAEAISGYALRWHAPSVVADLSGRTADLVWGENTPRASDIGGQTLALHGLSMMNSQGQSQTTWSSQEPGTIEVYLTDALRRAVSGAAVQYSVRRAGDTLPGYPRQLLASPSGSGRYADVGFIAPPNAGIESVQYALKVTATNADAGTAHAELSFTVAPRVVGRDLALLAADWDRPDIDNGEVQVDPGEELIVSFYVENQGSQTENNVTVWLELVDASGQVVRSDSDEIPQVGPGQPGYTDHRLGTSGLADGFYKARGRIDAPGDSDPSDNEMSWSIIVGNPPMQSDQLPLASYKLYRHDASGSSNWTEAQVEGYTIHAEYIDSQRAEFTVIKGGRPETRVLQEKRVYQFHDGDVVMWFERVESYSIPSPGYSFGFEIATPIPGPEFFPTDLSQHAFPYMGGLVSDVCQDVPEAFRANYDFYLPPSYDTENAYLVAYMPQQDGAWLDDKVRYWSMCGDNKVGSARSSYGGSLLLDPRFHSSGWINDYYCVVPDRDMPPGEYNLLIFQRADVGSGSGTRYWGTMHSVRLIVEDYHDLGVASLVAPGEVRVGESPPIQVTVRNNGSTSEVNLAVSLQVRCDALSYQARFEETVASIGSLGTATVAFDDWDTSGLAADRDYTITARVCLPGDMVAGNDSGQATVHLGPPLQLTIVPSGIAAVYDQSQLMGEIAILTWAEGSPVPNASVSYAIRSADEAIASGVLITNESGLGYVTGLTAPGAPGDYVLDMTAVKGGYVEAASTAPFSVRDSLPPSVPVLQSPADGAKLSAGAVSFDWLDAFDAHAGVSAYVLQADDDFLFGSPEIEATSADSSHAHAQPLAAGTYFWRVKAVDGSQPQPNESQWSAAASFTVLPANSPPVAEGLSVSTRSQSPVLISLGAADAETPAGDLTFLLATYPEHGEISALDPDAGTLVYTPHVGYFGEDSFQFQVRDTGNPPGSVENALLSELATVEVGVVAVGDLEIRITGPAGALPPRGSCTFEYVVSNRSDCPAVAPQWTDRLVLSTDQILGNADDVPLAEVERHGGLAAGGEYTCTVAATLPDLAAGTYYLLAATDLPGPGQQEETEELGNNWDSVAAVVTYRGDATLDGKVSAADYIALKRHSGAPTGADWQDGDFDGDSDVDRTDFLALKDNFGKVVPEPPDTPESLLRNGDFSEGIGDWDFVDDCQNSFGFNKVWVENERAWFHSYCVGNGGQGYLIQHLPAEVLPTYFRVDYKQVLGTGCGAVFLGLGREGGSAAVLDYRVGEQDVHGDYALLVASPSAQGVLLADHDRDFEEATFEAAFDYGLMEMTITVTCSSGKRLVHTSPIPSLEAARVSSVYVGAINNCWDGRNDQKGWFDNILLEVIPIALP